MARIEKNVLFLRTTYKKDVDLVGEIKMKYTFSRASQLLVTFLEEKAFFISPCDFYEFFIDNYIYVCTCDSSFDDTRERTYVFEVLNLVDVEQL